MVARVTADAVRGKRSSIQSWLETQPRSLEHPPLEGGPRDIQIILMRRRRCDRHHRFCKTLFGEGECVDMESTVTRILVTAEPERLVSGTCWNLNCSNHCFHCSLAVAAECFGLLRNQSVSSMRCSERQDRWYIFENHTEWRICSDPVQRLSRSGVLTSVCSVVFFPFQFCHCSQCCSLVCATDLMTSRAWLKSQSHPHCVTHIS